MDLEEAWLLFRGKAERGGGEIWLSLSRHSSPRTS